MFTNPNPSKFLAPGVRSRVNKYDTHVLGHVTITGQLQHMSVK
jgi:hypothetical protein